jgi:hypothetical protein
MKITKDYLQKRLEWDMIEDNISKGESRIPLIIKKTKWVLHYFNVLPGRKGLPFIYFCFDMTQDDYYLQQFGFSNWHRHFEDSFEEESNIKTAIQYAKKIMKGERFLIEQFNEKGKYIGGSMREHNDKLDLQSIKQNAFKTHII